MACGVFLLIGAFFTGPAFAVGYDFSFAAFLLLGVIALAVSVILEVVDLKRPFAEHVDRILERLPAEGALLDELNTFSAQSLERARRRLNLESAKVTSRLELIGGDVMKVSLVGLGALVYALFDQYRAMGASGIVVYLGFALLFGAGIGAWIAKFGASQANYYAELISMVIDTKTDLR